MKTDDDDDDDCVYYVFSNRLFDVVRKSSGW